MPKLKNNPTTAVKTRTSTRADAQIREDIENQLIADTRVSKYDVNVTVNDGVVNLTGVVPSYRAKNAASDDAWAVPGVINVINDISVSFETVEETVPTDVDIAANLESSLSWDPDVDATDINITVENGIVTLEGTVNTLWEKQLAEDKAWIQVGVVDVNNKLAVVLTEEIADEVAARNIVESIDRDRNVDVNDVDVEVSNGVATLSGSVIDVAAWRAAYNAAFYTSGIIQVKDNLSIEIATEETETKTLTRTDAQIKEDVEYQLRADNRVSSYDVNVVVDNGVVTLTGEVSSRRAKNAASDNAWKVPGVVNVTNNLSIGYATTEVGVLADIDTATNIQSSLSWDPDVDATDINVIAESGIVTLEGTVESLWTKQIAEDIAWDHVGVLDVKNKLAVAPAEDITDQAAAQSIVETIDRNISVDVNDVDVEVRDGEAFLSGTVSDIRAWRAAYDAAFYTIGVIRVRDNLSIA